MMNEEQQYEWDSWVEIATEDDPPSRCILSCDTLLAANAELEELRQQRDELLAALRRIVGWDGCGLALTTDHISHAKAAIAKAEGEKA